MQEQKIQDRARELTEWYGEAMAPTLEQWQRVLSGPDDTPVTLVNFFKLREETEEGVSGLESLMRYAAVSEPTLEKVGGRFLLRGRFETAFMGLEEDWDLIIVASYPDRAALIALHSDEGYRAAWPHRVAAVERQRVAIAAG